MLRALRIPLFATAIALGALPMTSCAQATQQPLAVSTDGTLLSVSAQAESKRAPDIATLSTGVVTRAADANAALRDNAAQMSKVVAAIRAAGIAERDVQTSGVSINPDYHYGENQPPKITGYSATNTVNVVVRDIGKLGKILDTLVGVGANQVNGPNFDIEDKEGAYNDARKKALAKAQKRAKLYAETLGLKVRRIVSISEGGGFGPPRPVPMMAMAKATASDAGSPISPGETALSVNLEVVFELGK